MHALELLGAAEARARGREWWKIEGRRTDGRDVKAYLLYRISVDRLLSLVGWFRHSMGVAYWVNTDFRKLVSSLHSRFLIPN